MNDIVEFPQYRLDTAVKKPIYKKLCDSIEEDIFSGRLPVGMRLPSDKELAKRIGVSSVTVTNAYAVLAKRGMVKRKVGDGTYIARSRKRCGIIGIIAGEYDPGWAGVIAGELARVLNSSGFQLQFLPVPGNDPVREKEIIMSIDPNKMDGIFVMANAGMEPHYEVLQQNGMTVIFGGKPFKKFPYVAFDDFRIGQIAAEHLLSIGVTDPGVIIEDYPVGRERLQGFVSAFAGAGIDIPEHRIFWVSQPYRLTDQQLHTLMNWKPFPQALFAHGDGYLIQVYHELMRDYKLRIPEDVALIGVGNAFNQHHIPLSSVSCNLVELGREAGRMFVDIIDNHYQFQPGESMGRRVEPILYIRQTTVSDRDS